MQRLLLAVILAAVAAAPALAQRSGTYAVEGASPGGARYEGALQLQATGPQTWRMMWTISGTTTVGVAITAGSTLVVGYFTEGQPGAASYEVQPDGRLVGRWTQGLQGGVGTETLTPR
ncbi:hypothetical protein [Plastoroseomonas arctica]|uniref:Uncharacterized protein n=1 Tax=Plastoroseomonas arctica TaxID=1509237 RepID=A0AAF1JY43_9PROT|nr:hypothetical protein [Plastoroseomonas arctica]MBR0656614.1 hypothetical protein [Plastoroseomonas arctica]